MEELIGNGMQPMPTAGMKVTTVTLKQMFYNNRKLLTMQDMYDVKATARLADIANHMVLELEAHIWAEELEETTQVIHVPASWWDHFKIEFYPLFWAWIGKPAMTKAIEVTFTRNAIFPDLRHDEEGSVLEYVIKEEVKAVKIEEKRPVEAFPGWPQGGGCCPPEEE